MTDCELTAEVFWELVDQLEAEAHELEVKIVEVASETAAAELARSDVH